MSNTQIKTAGRTRIGDGLRTPTNMCWYDEDKAYVKGLAKERSQSLSSAVQGLIEAWQDAGAPTYPNKSHNGVSRHIVTKISLDENTLAWLKEHSATTGNSVPALIRCAIAHANADE